jgi:hypothetical protein
VPDVAPWIHLACDTSFEDASGPPPEDFIRSLENLNREAIAASLKQCSQTRSKEVASEAVKALTETNDVQVRIERLDLLVASILADEPTLPLALELAEHLADSASTLLGGLPGDARVRLQFSLLAMMEHAGRDFLAAAAPAFAFNGAGDFQHVPEDPLGILASTVALDWLSVYYSQNAADCLRYLEDIIPRLELDSLRGHQDALGQRIAEDLLGDADPSHRTTRLGLVARFFRGYVEGVKEAVLSSIERQDVWDWARSEPAADRAPWTPLQLEQALVDFVLAADGTEDLYARLRYAAGKVVSPVTTMWETIAEQHPSELAALVDRLIGDSALASMPLPTSVATSLYEREALAVREAAESGDLSRACSQAQQRLNPNHWMWADVDSKRARKSMQYMARKGARPEALQQVLRPFFEHWGNQ